MVTVDWRLLAEALDHYQGQGFRRIDLPWHASRETCGLTCPDPDRMVEVPGFGVLVGSAEQAFMQMQFEGKLDAGRYVALTPCFRAEPVYDGLHLPYFMKVELYSAGESGDGLDADLARHARLFMLLSGARDVLRVSTDAGYDLEIGGVEVGSYSTRSWNGFTWTCGTGLAEPRFSTAVAKERRLAA